MNDKKVLLNVFLMATFLMGAEGKAQPSSDQPFSQRDQQCGNQSTQRQLSPSRDPNLTPEELWELTNFELEPMQPGGDPSTQCNTDSNHQAPPIVRYEIWELTSLGPRLIQPVNPEDVATQRIHSPLSALHNQNNQ